MKTRTAAGETKAGTTGNGKGLAGAEESVGGKKGRMGMESWREGIRGTSGGTGAHESGE